MFGDVEFELLDANYVNVELKIKGQLLNRIMLGSIDYSNGDKYYG